MSPNDVWIYAAVLGLLGGVGALAAYVPARRAARVEPLTVIDRNSGSSTLKKDHLAWHENRSIPDVSRVGRPGQHVAQARSWRVPAGNEKSRRAAPGRSPLQTARRAQYNARLTPAMASESFWRDRI
jgi:hypothetical protein